MESKKILITLAEEDVTALEQIALDLGLKYKNITVAFLIKRYQKREKISDKLIADPGLVEDFKS